MPGINRALSGSINEVLAKTNALLDRPCIFLSHISVDKESAKEIGRYIIEHSDIDIYLDVNDIDLQMAVYRNDPIGITRFIEKGLSKSTHIMCLVSEETVKSWWVPYELGFAKNDDKILATLKLKGNVDLPEYLQISRILHGTKSLNEYLKEVCLSSGIKFASHSLTENFVSYCTNPHPLDNYLDWNE